ncbi:hypothetical protein, partial [Marinagarivorans algicola]|uniref:hypothetical protein n=1 Tax=Marinagarivorans algicola TaxID=1513270 RepID=UPI0012E131AB
MKHTMHIGTLFFWNTQSQTRTFLLLLGTVLSSLLWVELAYAKYRVTGSVYAKGVVPSAAGNPYWIEYNALGQALENTAQEAVGDLAPSQVRVLSVQGYKDYQAQYQRLKSDYQDHPNKHLLLVDKNTALNLLIAGTGSGTGTGPADFNSPRYAADHYFAIIPPDSVEGNQYTYAQPQRSIILAAFPINPNDEPPFERGTLLLNTQGETVLSSKNTLGFATAYFVEEGGVTQPTQQYADGTIEPRNRINHSDILINPVRGVSVEMAGSIDQSDGGGRYEVYQPFMLCGVSLSSSGAWVSAMLSYQAFNPNNGSGIYPYFLMKLVPWRCQTLDFLTVGPAAFLGLGVWILAPPTIYPPHHYDIRVDFAAINGRARLFSPGIGRVGVGGDTHYSVSDDAAAQKFTTQTYLYDYDSDGKIDTPVFGRREIDNTGQAVFNTAADIPPAEHVVGVYLSGSGSIPGQDLPDIYREIDTQVSLTDQGLVDTISEEDLKNTDVYFFRESTGQLMAERTGATLANSDKNHHGVGVNDGEFVYTLHVRGPDANRHRSWASYSGSKDVNGKFVGSHNAFEGWQHDSGISPEFRKRDSDFIRPGEHIKIYAINRATGYIGSTRVYLRNPGQMTEEAPYKSLSQMANTIAMRPPNLKIWAERLGVDVANKAGDSQDYTIGNEGAALQSDQQVVVHTEWLDVDDKPLPAGLAGFGYTGRLARLTRDYYPDVLAGQQATFDITPGRHLEVVNVSNMTHTNDHIYVQVSGEPFNREPSFQRDALTPLTNDDEKFTYNNAHNRDGLLQYRPDRYVPFKVQVWDESATVAGQLAYNQAKVQGLASPASLIKPKPVYQWLYRPELQYSLYQLDINAIEREQDGIVQELQDSAAPMINSTDDLLRVLYDLQGSNKKMPGGFSFTGDKKDELIFAIGANEIKATIGDNQQIVFDDLNALALLDVEDFLSLRLYSNNDASNILWEWAFGATGLQVHYKIPAEETLIKAEVIAENNLYRVLGGLRLKYSYLLPNGATNPQFKWHFNDDGGRFCKGWGVGDKNCTKGKTAEGATLSEVYWEPKAWSSSVDVSAILTVSYERNGQKQEKIEQFKVMSRVLKPEATPMKGSDVA